MTSKQTCELAVQQTALYYLLMTWCKKAPKLDVEVVQTLEGVVVVLLHWRSSEEGALWEVSFGKKCALNSRRALW